MAAVFEDIRLEWGGEEFVIPSDRVMGAIMRVEEHVTLAELHEDAAKRRTVRMGRLASAYGSLLRYAGARVSDDEVYAGMFSGAEKSEATMTAMQGLMMMMVPPSAMTASSNTGPAPKKTLPSASSRKPSRPSSGRGG